VSGNSEKAICLDLNNPVFQRQLFALQKTEQISVLTTLRKVSKMTWHQVHVDTGLRWEAIFSRKGPQGERLYSFRLGKGTRAVAYRENAWMRILSIHPDHDSAYRT
jgi:hypothetical protein